VDYENCGSAALISAGWEGASQIVRAAVNDQSIPVEYVEAMGRSREPSDVMELELRFDRFEATVIADMCRNEGCQVELRLMDNSGQTPGLVAMMPHRIILHRADLAEIESIIRIFTPES